VKERLGEGQIGVSFPRSLLLARREEVGAKELVAAN
jgi:hypothetical protein